jgi:hypothetical protein
MDADGAQRLRERDLLASRTASPTMRGRLLAVNERWRICFEFRKGDAWGVEIVDYHRG